MTPEALIYKTVQAVAPMSKLSLEALMTSISVQEVNKGMSFVRRGQINEYEYFILDGVCHSYASNEENSLVSLAFYTSQTILSPHVTRTENNISNTSVEALSDLLIGKVLASDFLELMIHNIEIREFANQVLRNELTRKTRREVDMVSLTALQRLLKFRVQYPMLENQIAAPTLASYLGITPISLSRLRGQLSRTNK